MCVCIYIYFKSKVSGRFSKWVMKEKTNDYFCIAGKGQEGNTGVETQTKGFHKKFIYRET